MATSAEIKAFIQLLGGLAVAECNNRITAGKGFVLPSVCIAQSALETGYGTAGIMTKANAFFGIKAGGSWTGAVYRADTWEVANGESYNTTANFRAYGSLAESVTDYYNLIGNASRYSNGLSFGNDRSKWKTAKECIHAIWSGGYATDTLYVEKIMNIINARDLTSYDALVTGVGSAPINSPTLVIKGSQLTQGLLKVIDSGRAIENDRAVTTAVAMEWSKAIAVKGSPIYTINGIGDYQLFIAHLTGDIATINGPFTEGATLALNNGDKFAFYLMREDGASLSVENVKDFEITFNTDSLPTGAEHYATGIAHFVKVE